MCTPLFPHVMEVVILQTWAAIEKRKDYHTDKNKQNKQTKINQSVLMNGDLSLKQNKTCNPKHNK